MDTQTKRAALRAMEALIADAAIPWVAWYRLHGVMNEPEEFIEFFYLVEQYAKLLKVRVRHGRED
jgi:hypothetical protein